MPPCRPLNHVSWPEQVRLNTSAPDMYLRVTSDGCGLSALAGPERPVFHAGSACARSGAKRGP